MTGDLSALTAAVARLAAAIEHSNLLQQAEAPTATVTVEQECPMCQGSGVFAARQCTTCIGRGRFLATVPA